MPVSMRIRRAIIAAAVPVMLPVMAGTAAASAATVAPASTNVSCHTSGYEVRDSSGNPVTASYSVKSGSAYEGTVTVSLWYCTSGQSNFARAEFDTSSGQAETVTLSVYGEWGDGPNQANHALPPNTFSSSGSQDSPTIYAPVEPVEACAFPVSPFTFSAGSECTAFV